MNAELIRDVANADEVVRLLLRRRHASQTTTVDG
jgi:hypothetical protein